MTGTCGPEAEQLVASAEGGGEATSDLERGKRWLPPSSGLELSGGTGGGGGSITAIDLEKAVKFAQCASDSGMEDCPDPTSHGPLVETSRIPSAAGRGARSMSGFHAAADRCTAIDAGKLGLRVQ